MISDEITAMKSGKELNIKVAEIVMQCRFLKDEIFGDMEIYPNSVYGPLQPYSEDISAAWQVMKKLQGYNPRIEFNIYSRKWEAAFSNKAANFSFPLASADTAPEAICKAAILAVLEAKCD